MEIEIFSLDDFKAGKFEALEILKKRTKEQLETAAYAITENTALAVLAVEAAYTQSLRLSGTFDSTDKLNEFLQKYSVIAAKFLINMSEDNVI